MQAKLQEVSYVWIILGLNNNKQVAADVVRAPKAGNKMWLIVLQCKRQQKMYAIGL